jgi:GntR family carbon starvation induced transcriptional regulator
LSKIDYCASFPAIDHVWKFRMTADPSPSRPKLTRASNVSLALKRSILDGALEPGARVNLDALRKEYGVSLSPMREAISRLVADWLVVFEDQRGYRIAPISEENLAEVTRLRADLSALALGHAIAGADLNWESNVMADLHRLTRAEPADVSKARNRLHSALVDGCGMAMLQETCARLGDLHRRYARILDDRPPPGENDELSDVAHAAVARDAELAPALLRRHIERIGARLSRLMAT